MKQKQKQNNLYGNRMLVMGLYYPNRDRNRNRMVLIETECRIRCTLVMGLYHPNRRYHAGTDRCYHTTETDGTKQRQTKLSVP